MRTLIKALLILLLSCSTAWADSVNISDRGGGDVGYCHDNVIYEAVVANNWGGNTAIAVGKAGAGTSKQHAILRFDSSQIPTGADVTAVSLVQYVTSVVGGGVTVNAHELVAGNYGWGEGTGSGAGEPQEGMSCWNYGEYDTVPWAGGAGCDVSGTDYKSTSYGSVAMTSTGSKTIVFNATGIQAVEDSISGGTFEIILLPTEYTDTTRSLIASSENATTANRPYLAVTYTPQTGRPQVTIVN